MDYNIPITGLVPHALERISNGTIDPGSPRCPLVIAHRDDISAAPETTMPAFYRAIESGADVGEKAKLKGNSKTERQ